MLGEQQAIENQRITKLNQIENAKQESLKKLAIKYESSDKAATAFNIIAILVLVIFYLLIASSDLLNLICFTIDRFKKAKKNKINGYKFKRSKPANNDEESFDYADYSDRVNSRLELFELRLYESVIDSKLKQAKFNGHI